MAKQPAFQFYVGDWLKDPNLRRCSHAAKGVWIDALCLMFESEERGVLATANLPWSDDEVAQAIGGDRTVTLACMSELTLKGVMHRDTRGALYSKRMVRDEHKRQACSEAGKRGGNPTLKGNPKGESKRKPTPSSSSSSSELVPSPSAAPSKPGEPHGDHNTLVDFFCRGWKKKYSGEYDFRGGRDGSHIRDVLKSANGKLDLAKRIVAEYLADNDDKLIANSRHPLGLLISNLSKYRLRATKSESEVLAADQKHLRIADDARKNAEYERAVKEFANALSRDPEAVERLKPTYLAEASKAFDLNVWRCQTWAYERSQKQGGTNVAV